MSNSPTAVTAPSPAEVWATGDYADVCDRMVPRLGARLVELAGISAEQEALDVAAGTGNAAIPAARARARVTALDITPELIETGQERSAAAGVDVRWICGDAQALPFADASFDVVLSCVGVQFCPDGDAAAAELARVCRPGGRIALVSWTPEGFIGQALAAIGGAMGNSGPSPLRWGSEGGLQELFDEQGVAVTRSLREHVDMPADSATGWVDYMAQAYGPMSRARSALTGRGAWEPLRERLIAIAQEHAVGGASFVARAEYLAVVIEH